MNNEAINKALEKVKNRKKHNEANYDNLINKAIAENKEIAEITNLMSTVGAKIAMTAMTGNEVAVAALRDKLTLLSAKKADMLKAAGIPNRPEYTCKKCNDAGIVDQVLCSCVLEELKKDACNQFSNDMGFENFNLTYYPEKQNSDGYSPKKVMANTFEICKKFVKEFPCSKNLLFMGGCGLGKTHLTVAICKEIAANGYDVIYGSAQNILSKAVKSEMDWSSDGTYVENLLSCDLLALDDLGTEFSTAPANAMLYNIINTRLVANKSTLISTNLEFDELEKKYDPRIVSRFIGNYSGRYFLGNDIRQAKANER